MKQMNEMMRHVQLLKAAIAGAKAFAPQAESAGVVQVERGTVLARAIQSPPSADAVELKNVADVQMTAVVDARGHQRPVYRPLLVYSWLRSYEVMAAQGLDELEGIQALLLDACQPLWAVLSTCGWPDAGMPAARGAMATEVCWNALAVSVAGNLLGRADWRLCGEGILHRVVRAQRANGPFLAATASDNPETHWYHELVILHAITTFAVQSGEAAVRQAVEKAALFHQDETQPDHASTQPWGLFAFLWNPQTHPLADQLLHAAGTQHPGRISGISLMLLADALYCAQQVSKL